MANTLTTSRLLLREWRDDDLPAFAALNDDPRAMAFFPRRLTREESDAFVARARDHFARHRFGWWVVETADAPFVGFVGLAVVTLEVQFAPCVEIGWRLACTHWGYGYATEAARAVLAHGFGPLGLRAVVAFTAEGNARSRAVMERLGMRRDPADDFDHPRLPAGHLLRRHVLYRLP